MGMRLNDQTVPMILIVALIVAGWLSFFSVLLANLK